MLWPVYPMAQRPPTFVWQATLDAFSPTTSEAPSPAADGTPAAGPTSRPLWESALAFYESESASAEESGAEEQEVPSAAKKPKPSSRTVAAWLSKGTRAQLWAHRCDPATMEADRIIVCACARGNCAGNITANGMSARRAANQITGTVEGGEEGRSQRDYCRGRLRDFLEPGDEESSRTPPSCPRRNAQ